MSAKKHSFEINRTSSAPPAKLFELETDGANWSNWGKPLIMSSGWAERGDQAPGGVGAIRKVGTWPLLLRERTLEYELDRRHVYTFAGPVAPARDYRAEVTFSPNERGGTDLRWAGSFSAILPGTGAVTAFVLRTVIQFLSARLVRAAERG
ncbi:SRPBCC family protein [Amycolatopsis nigrescens]|uniref:SRPBCC family protein n=1 Tax=Amycolatopsis nigrescens TaxID=381445 RepID=UPI00035CB6F0|nr:SRPBCC family protein [Amycolatopsis nigrescens]